MRCLLSIIMVAYLVAAVAQSNVDFILNNASKTQLQQFAVKDLAENQVFLAMPYAGSIIINKALPPYFQNSLLERIDLVYTAFPPDNAPRQRSLNKDRILSLYKQIPESKYLDTEQWGLIEQIACPNELQARALPHGFLLTFFKIPEMPNFADEQQLQILTKGDSTVTKALTRNKNWNRMLVVTDLTGSMSPFTAQLLLWFKLAHHAGKVQHLVFFNDGNGKEDELKMIGSTGGIYDISPNSFDEIAQIANQVVERGNGGDEPENNVEAILHGIKVCPTCQEIVMIADNWATPRDYALIRRVNKPIHIILCGTDEGINANYLNLARETGGSVHTIEQDITDLLTINEGQEIKIGKEIFVIKNGKFELFKRI